MTANATQRAVKSLMRKIKDGDKLNILTFATHERYEENLCKTGHNFYSLKIGKEWDTDYTSIPKNYHVIDSIPDHIDFDLILSHTSCERLQIAHNMLSQTSKSSLNKLSIPIIRHCHVLPDVRMDVNQQVKAYKIFPANKNSFISNFNKAAWGFEQEDAQVIEHGVDTDFWKPDDNVKRIDWCLSVVNDWPNRDWCCGWNLWKKTVGFGGGTGTNDNPWMVEIPISVWGKSPGLSVAARDNNHLRSIYQKSSIFYNTSIHSPVPTVLLEAMACGCAVVSTATCMIPEIIQHGKNGLISNDPDELRGYLELLLKKPHMARKLGEAARKTILEKYNMSRFVEDWNNLFYDTIENYSDVTEKL